MALSPSSETAEDFSAPAPVESKDDEVPQFETFAVVDDDEVVEPVPVVAEEFETNAAPGSTFSDPTASFADLNDDEPAGGFATGANDFQEVDFSIVETAAPPAPSETGAAEDERLDNMMRQELESVDFYIAQGYADIAVDTLEMLERQFGSHPDIQARRDKLAERDKPVAEAAEVFEFGGVEELSATPAPEPIGFDADVAYASLASEVPAHEGNNSGGNAQSTPGLDAGLAELFEEFRVAEEGDDVREDYETHYNMGTAYKEMDLMDEAIQEFQVSASLVKPGDGTSRFLQCCNMLGHCFIQKGMPEAAVLWFKKGLSAPGHSEDEYQALRYELASAY